jgi:hypothetical protein
MQFSETRSLERWNIYPYHEHKSIDAFMQAGIANGLHSIFSEGVPIDIHANINKGCPLVVFFNGNAPRSDSFKLPTFAGLGVLPQKLGVSRICVNDPSLYLSPDLCLSWYCGSSELALQQVLPSILARVFEVAQPSRIIFTGGSGGGFASMYYSRFFPGSLAFVWNPQTDILEYNPAHVTKYASTAFGCKEDILSVRITLPSLIDVKISRFYSTNKNNVLYLQNRSDWHVKKHLMPFLKEALGLDDLPAVASGLIRPDFYLHLGEWGNGHIPPPKDLIAAILRHLTTSGSRLDDVLKDDGMREVLNHRL